MNNEFLKMQKLAGLITEGQYKAKLNENMGPTPEKRKMLLDKLKNLVPGQEKEFLEFMAAADGDMEMDYSNKSLESLLDGFIRFEEDNNDEEFTEEVADEVLNIYVPGFERGEHVF